MIKFKSMIVFAAILFSIIYPPVWSMTVQSFDKESYHQIVENNKNRAFLLVLWSVDCPPCYEELSVLEHYTKINPELKIIFISTDSSVSLDEIKEVISEKNLQNQELWVFSNIPSNQLRYTIDPSWYGELPRSYFFDQCHHRQSFSGKLTIEKIEVSVKNSDCDM